LAASHPCQFPEDLMLACGLSQAALVPRQLGWVRTRYVRVRFGPSTHCRHRTLVGIAEKTPVAPSPTRNVHDTHPMPASGISRRHQVNQPDSPIRTHFRKPTGVIYKSKDCPGSEDPSASASTWTVSEEYQIKWPNVECFFRTSRSNTACRPAC